MKHLPSLIVLLLSLVTAPLFAKEAAQADAQPKTQFDRWYVLELQGQPAGHVHNVQYRQGDTIVTQNDMRMSLKRGPITVNIKQSQTFKETPDGQPIQATNVMDMGMMAVHKTYHFSKDGITVTSAQGGQQQTQTLPAIQGDWLPPAAAQRFISKQLADGAKTIKVRTIDLSMGVSAVEATMTVLGPQNVQVFGKTVPAIAWDTVVSSMPGMKMREYVDAKGRTLKSNINIMPGMELTMIEADETLAKADVNPPELVASMLLHPMPGSVAMVNPRQLRSAVYEVTLKPDASIKHFDLPQAGYQHVVWGDQRTAKVVVDLSRPVNPQRDVPTAADLAASSMINKNDPKIQALVRQALGAGVASMTDVEKARKLREFVQSYVTQKDLAIGFATASEVARTREGDCSEHAVLLTAMLRAAGIPSRVATGLVYVNQFIGKQDVFGGHMWSQAWLTGAGGAGAGGAGVSPVKGGGRWVDLDATLPEQTSEGFDAAHIALGVATLDNASAGNELMKMAPLLGSLNIKVVAAK